MQRIAIVGCSGGGKSTLARALGARLGLPIVHMDTLFWKPGWTHSDPELFRLAVEAAAKGEAWIIDGNFISASTAHLARADTVIWLELPRALCLWRAVWRALSAFGAARSDLAPGCPEKIDFAFYRYIWNWDRLTRPRMSAALLVCSSEVCVIRLGSDQEVAQFLTRMNSPSPTARTSET